MWEFIERELPDSLDQMAKSSGALVRCKGVDSAHNLLRVILTYGVTDLSLKAVAAWGSSVGLVKMSGVALYYRVKDAKQWLAQIIAALLNEQTQPSIAPVLGLRVKLVDATCVTGPAATGCEWRLHTEIAPDTGQITGIKLTDDSVGETYANYAVEVGDVLVGDRAYALANSMGYVHGKGGYVVARANLNSIRLCRLDRTVFHPAKDAALVPKAGVLRYDVLIPVPPKKLTKSHKSWKNEDATNWIQARLLAVRAMKTKEVIWVITTVPEQYATDEAIMEIFRVRWQIELEFKRLKSLLGLDALPSRQGPTAESWILARILAAILIERLLRNSGVFSPWGYRLV
jgi:hypothetical protein